MKPRVFRLVGLDHEQAAFDSAIISNKSVYKDKRCKICRNASLMYEKITLVQGYDDFCDADLSKKGFLGFDFTPLYGFRDIIKKAVEKITGTSYVIVGYADWNQQSFDKRERYTRLPLLGGLTIKGKLQKIFVHGLEPVKCETCGSYNEEQNIDPQDIILDYSSWDGSDMFTVYYDTKSGYFTYYITEIGLRKLHELGIKNLRCEEAYWA